MPTSRSSSPGLSTPRSSNTRSSNTRSSNTRVSIGDLPTFDEPGDLLASSAFMDLGSCRGTDPEVFFPDRGESLSPAKAVCAECIVAEECLEYALVNGERFGVWGGTSERERRRIRRSRREAAEVAAVA